jgi:aryl-phospho-beta-D-glucosidase BglC (GH1 family)
MRQQGVAMDTHIYQVFSNDEVAMTQAQHISAACGKQSSLSSFNGHLWTIVGVRVHLSHNGTPSDRAEIGMVACQHGLRQVSDFFSRRQSLNAFYQSDT